VFEEGCEVASLFPAPCRGGRGGGAHAHFSESLYTLNPFEVFEDGPFRESSGAGKGVAPHIGRRSELFNAWH